MQQDHTVLLVENTPTVGEGQEQTAGKGKETGAMHDACVHIN